MVFSCTRLESGKFAFVFFKEVGESCRWLNWFAVGILGRMPSAIQWRFALKGEAKYTCCAIARSNKQHILLVGPMSIPGRILSLEDVQLVFPQLLWWSLLESTMLPPVVSTCGIFWAETQLGCFLHDGFLRGLTQNKMGLRCNQTQTFQQGVQSLIHLGWRDLLLVVGWWALHECSFHGRNNGTGKDW